MQRERDEFQRQASDDESQYDVLYNQETPLMASELALQEQAAPRTRSVPKVHTSTLILCLRIMHMYSYVIVIGLWSKVWCNTQLFMYIYRPKRQWVEEVRWRMTWPCISTI